MNGKLKLRTNLKIFGIAAAAFVCALLFGGTAQAQTSGQSSVINIQIQRTIPVVNYWAKGSTKVDFQGTAFLPKAEGQAKVESKGGALAIDASFSNLTPASQFGNAYLVYVLWAITPEGRANNLGQLILNGTKSKLQTSTRLQTFGLMVTAEPYFAVSAPSETVIMENVVRPDTKGQVDAVNANFELLQRGKYREANLSPVDSSGNAGLDLLQARNAMRIAKYRGADKYAPESWAKAMDALNRAEDYNKRKQKNAIPTAARDAVQGFEDAITIALKRQDDERLANERAASAQREAEAKAQQDAAAKQAEQAKAEQEEEARKREKAEKERLQAELASAKDAAARAEAEKAQAAADAAALAAQQQAAKEKEAAEQAEREKQQLRANLLAQFNKILETRDTPRGLVVNLGDVLFAFGKYDLKPEARERLAKLSGIVIAHPGLHLDIEGYTDNVGSDAINQTLSEQRANAVKEYLVSQGLDASSITTKGFGKAMPVADNATAAGRQQNRRVEIVISGEVIGTKIGGTASSQ